MNIIIMILLISFLVMVHEAGHFLAAKLFKIRVDKFGFGLPVGPTLWKKKFGETEFVIHAVLLGGYVAFPDDDKNVDIPEDSPERFRNKPVWQRMIVIVAGVFANFVTAILLVMLTAGIWHKLPAGMYETSIEEILPEATVSVKSAGIENGDVFYTINGTKVELPTVLTKYLALSKSFDGLSDAKRVDKKTAALAKLNPSVDPDKVIPVGTTIYLTDFDDEDPVYLSYDQVIGFEKYVNSEIELTDLQKALRDKIYGKKTYKTQLPITFEDLAFAVSDTQKPLNIVVMRNDKQVNLNTIYPDKNGFMGIKKGIVEVMYPISNFKDNVEYSMKYINTNSYLMLYGLGKLFTGHVPMKEMHGIVAITKIGSDVIEYQGLFKGLILTAFISLNLAYLNLLPIPALDGGHLMFLIIEKIMGKPVNEKVSEIIANIFFYLLILLMFYIIFNDIVAIVTKRI